MRSPSPTTHEILHPEIKKWLDAFIDSGRIIVVIAHEEEITRLVKGLVRMCYGYIEIDQI
jgi:hypothetical protein